MGGGRGSKMSKNDPRYTSKFIHVWGGERSEKPKNQSTWFVDDPLGVYISKFENAVQTN